MKWTLRYLPIGLICALGAACTTPASKSNMTSVEAGVSKASAPVTAHLSGTAFVTRDIEASLAFYSNYLEYTVRRRRMVDVVAGENVWGLPDGAIDYVAMTPPDFSTDKPYPGLNFAQIVSSSPRSQKMSTARGPRDGEPVFAYSVTGLDIISERMAADDVPVVNALSISPTGRSRTLTVLDPNGLRVQMYEILSPDE